MLVEVFLEWYAPIQAIHQENSYGLAKKKIIQRIPTTHHPGYKYKQLKTDASVYVQNTHVFKKHKNIVFNTKLVFAQNHIKRIIRNAYLSKTR